MQTPRFRVNREREPAKVKVEGDPDTVNAILAVLENEFRSVRTSGLIRHAEDSRVHIYLAILEEA